MNTYCQYCLDIHTKASQHECTGSLKERISNLESALKPFLALTETAAASIGQIKQSDIQYAKELLEGKA